jgi:transcriptional regulator with XRE-family HTH domain
MAPNYRLKQARELRGWSQAKVAEQIGTDATTVSRWERGIFFPTPYFREKLCILFEKNAEELGLMEPMRFSPPRTQKFQDQTQVTHTPEFEQPQAASMADQQDTFAYILESASLDQQAHMLWEYAYVQALRGRHSEAQQLGKASLDAFEQSGHPNAVALREWLLQHDLLSARSSSGNLSQDASLSPRPRPYRPTRFRFPWGSAGIFFVIILVAAGLLSGLALYQPHPSLSSPVSSSASKQAQETQTTQFTSMPAISSRISTPSPVVSAPTPSPTATSTAHFQASSTDASTPTATPSPHPSSSTLATLTPSQLTSHNCVPDSQTYRCTVTLAVGSSTAQTFTWNASGQGIIAQINPTNGQITVGQPYQVIIYINQSSPSGGTLVFTFHGTASGETSSVSASWQG